MKSKVIIQDGFEDKVTGNELKYLIKLGRFLCNTDRTAWPSTSTLSTLTKLSVKTIYNITQSLEDKKIIEVARAKVGKLNAVNKYRLLTKGISFSITDIGRDFLEEEGGVKITDGGSVKITEELSTSKEVHVHSKINLEFDALWNAYGKKKAKAKSFSAYKNLTKKERIACAEAIPAYVASTPDVQYRALLTTYIHGKRWEDEITEGHQAPPEATNDIQLNETWEASYQRFTDTLKEKMGDRAKMVSPLTRAQYYDWFKHTRRPLTGRLHRKTLAKELLSWMGKNAGNMNTYKLQKEIKTTDALFFHAYTEILKETGRWGEFSESVAA